MKKHFFWRFSLILSLLFAGYWAVTYANLKNPMSEMMYSETSSLNLLTSQSLSKVIGSRGRLKKSEFFTTLMYSPELLKNNEQLSITLFRVTIHKGTGMFFMYNFELENNVYISMIFDYDLENNSLIQNELYLDKNNVKYENQELINELANYGKNLDWLQNQSRKVVEDYILGTWFEHGSDRYSLDNLGNLTIEYHELVTEE